MIIQSLLDTDLYKFTMMQVVQHHFAEAQVEYRFKCRNANVDLSPYVAEIEDEIRALCDLRFTQRELDYLRRWRFFKSDFVDLLGLFHLDQRFIKVTRIPGSPGEIDITIKGPWLHTILFEVPVLAIVSEVYSRNTVAAPDFAEGRKRLAAKIAQANEVPGTDFRIADYGTRRRFSRVWAGGAVRDAQARHESALRRYEQRPVRSGARPDAARHDGARIPAGVPGRRAAAARF